MTFALTPDKTTIVHTNKSFSIVIGDQLFTLKGEVEIADATELFRALHLACEESGVAYPDRIIEPTEPVEERVLLNTIIQLEDSLANTKALYERIVAENADISTKHRETLALLEQSNELIALLEARAAS